MTLNDKESLVQTPLDLGNSPKESPREDLPLRHSFPSENSGNQGSGLVVNEDRVVSEHTKQLPSDLSLSESAELERLLVDLERIDTNGSVPTYDIEARIAVLRAKERGDIPQEDVPEALAASQATEPITSSKYSLEKRIFAPESVYMNLDPIDITEDGRPVYTWISGRKGFELRESGVLMRPARPVSKGRRR